MPSDKLSRRKALSTFAAVSGAALLNPPNINATETSSLQSNSDVDLFTIKNITSGQLTTYNHSTKQKAPDIRPGEKYTLAEYNSPGIITRFWMTCAGWFWEHWDVRKEKYPDQAILKKLILRIYYDGNTYPSIEAPINDFFGIGHPEYKHYLSKYLGMSSGGFYCYLPMPFNKIKIEVENLHSTKESAVFLNANLTKLDRLPANAGRLHCVYSQGTNSGASPLTILKTTGRGHYVGCCLSMQSFLPNYLGYLEAPEYIYIDTDNKSIPTIAGTGLEDYFNGGWYFRDGEFHAPLHGVPIKDALRSMVSMYRFHENDAIYFDKSFEMEFVNPKPANTLQEFKFSSTAYWYQDKAVQLNSKLPLKENLVNWYRIRDTDHQSIP